MVDVLTTELSRFVRAAGPDPDDTLTEMDEFAREEGFPHVGPEVGAFLRFVARLGDADRIFEFGSGYGYSAYWFAEALPADGEIVLTEVDEAELEQAREYMAAGGYDDVARYELGDALETVERYEGPFDVVLLDLEKHRYEAAFEAVRSKVPVGGVVVADNAISANVIEFDALLEIVEAADGGEESASRVAAESNEHTRGIAAYLERVRDEPAFETVVVPLGEGIAVSYRVE
ncbi:O-methyltransferase [Natrialba asiatica]|uniref:O-methyltransferase family protein n=1 Tax=Natrialba asiatica (strain ATCC 700177 / DSM 12278 / JCM 9576 / FERM P-10747 / NBRC 102637 / 172P1) TaxID=29540 RepID=M0AT47_NATA1|nr:O-methyltransferase [Natrialba asiatica]ELZ00534.1 O-methyltransferase family protein [Natrialba asiatica DSM 12278]